MKKMHKFLTGSIVLGSMFALTACDGETNKEAKTDADGNIVMTIGQQTQPTLNFLKEILTRIMLTED